MIYSAPPPLPFHYDRLHGKVIFTTGASCGIGEASAKLFAREGVTVVVSARRKDRLDTLVNDLEIADLTAATVCDVSNEESVKNPIQSGIDKDGKIDGAMNSGGIIIPPTALRETSSADFDRLRATNTRGVFLCMKYEITAMLSTSTGGSVVNVSGITGVKGIPGALAHASSKFALTGLTRCAALDYAPKGIRVNVVAPGPVHSEGLQEYAADSAAELAKMTPMNRISDAEDVGRTMLSLLTDESRWTTGAVLTSDGGMAAGSGS